ncbi:MAG: YkgJ family cysteine cluster protein [Promethearchaeota archaeon]
MVLESDGLPEQPEDPTEGSEIEEVPTEPNETKSYTDNPYYCITDCDGHCCRDYTVLITAQDAMRILDNIPGLDILKFICFYEGSVETLNYYPKIVIKGQEYCIGILTDPRTESCVFQTGLGMCGIHSFSPMVCQTYPFTLTEEGKISYIEGIYCKELFPPSDKDKVRSVIRQSWDEIKVYRRLVAEWNEKLSHRGTRKFLKFAGLWDYEGDEGPEADIKFDWDAAIEETEEEKSQLGS